MQSTNVTDDTRRLDSSIPLIPNPRQTTDYLTNPEDKDDEKINKQLFEIGMVARELFTDNSYSEVIISEAKEHDNSCADLVNFIGIAKSLKSNKHTNTFSNLEQLLGKINLTHKSINPQKSGEIETYIPAIFVVNVETADFSKLPIISPGTYVNSSLPGMEEYEDYVVAWYSDGMGGFNEILINEETAMSTTHPVFVIDNAEHGITKRPKSTLKLKYSTPIDLKNQETAWYSSYEYQINHRYERSGKSEFCITGAHITESGSVELICRKQDGTYHLWKRISRVHKDDIGQLLFRWEQFCSNNVTPLNSNYIFWNTYERDWAKSEKDLGTATENGTTIYLYGRRKYTSEWYAYHPDQFNNNAVDLNTIYNSWAKWYSNSKGKFRIWRIQP